MVTIDSNKKVGSNTQTNFLNFSNLQILKLLRNPFQLKDKSIFKCDFF